MKLKKVEKLIRVLKKAEAYRRVPGNDVGSCIGGDGIYMVSGKKEICIVNSVHFQGSDSKRYEIIEMLPFIQKMMPECLFYYNCGWLD
jgi:hypothetical protein